MPKRLPPLSWPQQQRTLRCGSCGKLYVGRPRQETVCLTCDIRGRAARGESPAAIAVRFGIPRFLVEAVLEPDSHPTRRVPLGGRRSSILGDPRARSFAETAQDQPFRTIRAWLAMGEDSGSSLEPSPATLGASGPGGNAGDAPAALLHLPRRPLDLGRRFAALRVPQPPSVGLPYLPLDLPGAVGVCLAQRSPLALVVPVEILAPAFDQVLPAPDRPGSSPADPASPSSPS